MLLAKYLADHWTTVITLVTRAEVIDSNGKTGYEILHHVKPLSVEESIGAISAAMGCIIGHNFPVWLRFKGGKGMA